MQLVELRKELQFNGELYELIGTLKNIAAAQYHMMEKEKERFNQFMEAFSEFFRVVNLVEVESPFVRETTDRMGIVIVTSDSGFMGGLNQGVIRAALRAQGDHPHEQTELMVIGEKGATGLADVRRAFKHFPGIDQTRIYEQAVEIKNYIVERVREGRFSKVILAYPRPLSFTAQTVEVIDLLPCSELFDRNADSEIAQRVSGMRFLTDARKVIVESSFSGLVEQLAGVWVTSKLFEVFEDSKLAEYSARAMHLEDSIQKLEKKQKQLQHACFKATHEKIDKGMRESFAAGKQKKKRAKRAAA